MNISRPRLVAANVIYFFAVHLLALVAAPLWGLLVGFNGWAWLVAGVIWLFSGLSITAGYHRLWSHRSYKASMPLKIFFLIFGTFALQNSVLVWCARHRVHHQHVDDVQRDPHSIRSGLWHAHIGWMLRSRRSSAVEFDRVRDLEADPLLRWQHRYYWVLTWALNLGAPVMLGFLVGDVVGMVLLAGAVRLVWSHHCTFLINSLAHTAGKRNYGLDNSSRDNGWLALLTWGEGYHNFHHAFQADYRNGARWWHFDPGKWLIWCCSKTGLARELKRTPAFVVRRARLQAQFGELENELAVNGAPETLIQSLEREYQQFSNTVSQWQSARIKRFQAGAAELRGHWRGNSMNKDFHKLERQLKQQLRRLASLQRQWSAFR